MAFLGPSMGVLVVWMIDFDVWHILCKTYRDLQCNHECLANRRQSLLVVSSSGLQNVHYVVTWVLDASQDLTTSLLLRPAFSGIADRLWQDRIFCNFHLQGCRVRRLYLKRKSRNCTNNIDIICILLLVEVLILSVWKTTQIICGVWWSVVLRYSIWKSNWLRNKPSGLNGWLPSQTMPPCFHKLQVRACDQWWEWISVQINTGRISSQRKQSPKLLSAFDCSCVEIWSGSWTH